MSSNMKSLDIHPFPTLSKVVFVLETTSKDDHLLNGEKNAHRVECAQKEGERARGPGAFNSIQSAMRTLRTIHTRANKGAPGNRSGIYCTAAAAATVPFWIWKQPVPKSMYYYGIAPTKSNSDNKNPSR